MAVLAGGPPGNVVQPATQGTNPASQRGAIAGIGLVHPEPWKAFTRQWSLMQLPSVAPVFVTGGGPFTVAITTAQESDTAFAIVPSKKRLIGLAGETDTAFQIKPSHVKLIGLAAESDTAFAIGHKKTRLIGLAAESDTAFAIRPSHVKLIGLAGESDTAFAIVGSKKRLIGLAGESDTAFAIAFVKGGHVVGLAVELDTAFAIAASKSALPVVAPPAAEETIWVEMKIDRNPHRPRGLRNRRGW